jgi:hypothetical protein
MQRPADRVAAARADTPPAPRDDRDVTADHPTLRRATNPNP